MNDYISRQTVLRCIKESRNGIDWGQSEDGDAFLHYSAALYRTVASKECVPAADVAPVVHGKWIPHSEKSREYIGTVLVHVKYDYWLCDTCGYRVENGQPMYNFCPNCGARMIYGERKENCNEAD